VGVITDEEDVDKDEEVDGGRKVGVIADEDYAL
jgi:hypothetical protein